MDLIVDLQDRLAHIRWINVTGIKPPKKVFVMLWRKSTRCSDFFLPIPEYVDHVDLIGWVPTSGHHHVREWLFKFFDHTFNPAQNGPNDFWVIGLWKEEAL